MILVTLMSKGYCITYYRSGIIQAKKQKDLVENSDSCMFPSNSEKGFSSAHKIVTILEYAHTHDAAVTKNELIQ